jgi:5-methylcytosine-specific restriction endonuclease McrA
MMMGESKDGSPPALALDIHYDYNDVGKPDVAKMQDMDRLDWEYWLILEPRRGDLDAVVHTSKRVIRVPTIIVCPKFYMNPMREIKPSPKAIRRRDGNKCVYTGVELTNATFTLDHIHPRALGGQNTWENLVSCHKDVNAKKGNRTNAEAGLVLKRKPVAPKPVPTSMTVEGCHHPDHYHF